MQQLVSLEALGTWTRIESIKEIRVGGCWSSLQIASIPQ